MLFRHVHGLITCYMKCASLIRHRSQVGPVSLGSKWASSEDPHPHRAILTHGDVWEVLCLVIMYLEFKFKFSSPGRLVPTLLHLRTVSERMTAEISMYFFVLTLVPWAWVGYWCTWTWCWVPVLQRWREHCQCPMSQARTGRETMQFCMPRVSSNSSQLRKSPPHGKAVRKRCRNNLINKLIYKLPPRAT